MYGQYCVSHFPSVSFEFELKLILCSFITHSFDHFWVLLNSANSIFYSKLKISERDRVLVLFFWHSV